MHDARGWVSVVELIVYIPALIVAAIICRRHGFGRSYGWIYTLILCVVRIAGAGCQLYSYHDHSSGLIQATIIIDSIGLSPLLLATLGMLSRLTDSINARSPGMLSVKHFRILQLLITIGLILSIAGGTSGSVSADGTVTVATTSKIGIGLYILAYIALVLITLLSLGKVSSIPSGEKSVLVAVIFALPFILSRLVYSTLSVVLHNHLFNIVTGSVVVLVTMAVVEEFIVVAAYLLLGFKVDKLSPSQQGPIANRPWKNQKNKGGRRGRGRGDDQELQYEHVPQESGYTNAAQQYDAGRYQGGQEVPYQGPQYQGGQRV